MKHVFYSLLLVLLVVSLVSAQRATGVAVLTINSTAATIEIANVDGGVSEVIPNKTYTVLYDAALDPGVIYPIYGAEVVDGAVGFDITTSPGAQIIVEFIFPPKLVGEFNAIEHIEFINATRLEDGFTFNPNVPTMLSLGTGGTAGIRFDYRFTTPSSFGDAYVGNIIGIAYFE